MAATKKPVAILSAADVGVLAAKVAKRVDTVIADVQKIVIACVGYSLKDRNITPANDAIKHFVGLKGFKVQSFVSCLEKLGNFKYDSDTKKFVFRENSETTLTLKDTPESILAFMTEMNTNPKRHWTEFKKDPELKSSLDMQDELKKFLARMEKESKREGVTVHHAAALQDIKAVAKKYGVKVD